ncbi:MAG: HAMP domain-containing sensor histidine kinase [Thermoleophilia bacterium]
MTLRLRLLLALVGLVAAGLLIADAATYLSLRAFMVDRVDQQLADASQPISGWLNGFGRPSGSGTQAAGLPVGTYARLQTTSGEIVQAGTVVAYEGQSLPSPSIPKTLPVSQHDRPVLFTTGAIGDRTHFRVLAATNSSSGQILIVAIPLTEVQQTLTRLLTIEAIVTGAVLLGLGVLAWWLVRRELRPLEGMAAAAGRIAAGDLSERVAPAERKTEVGRLGLALNAMLERIEHAFAERTASEERLRRFLADASHELRTPLTSIRGYAEMFHRGAKDNADDLALVMRRIEEEGQRMGIMVDELLLLARLGEGREPEREAVNLGRIVADAVSDARAANPERDIELTTPDELYVLGDDPQLRQVVANLLGNALRHTPATAAVRATAATDGSSAVLTVSDEGPGMPPEVAARVFEPFYRADPARARTTGGAGLGLAIVAAIVQAHGGSIALQSEDGDGSTFTVRLPLTSAPATPVSESDADLETTVPEAESPAAE